MSETSKVEERIFVDKEDEVQIAVTFHGKTEAASLQCAFIQGMYPSQEDDGPDHRHAISMILGNASDADLMTMLPNCVVKVLLTVAEHDKHPELFLRYALFELITDIKNIFHGEGIEID